MISALRAQNKDKKWMWNRSNRAATIAIIFSVLSFVLYFAIFYLQTNQSFIEASGQSQLLNYLALGSQWIERLFELVAFTAAIISLFPGNLKKGGIGYTIIALVLRSIQPIIGMMVSVVMFISQYGQALDSSAYTSVAFTVVSSLLELAASFIIINVALKQLKPASHEE